MDPLPQGAPSLWELCGLHPQGAQRPGATHQGCGAGPQGSFCAEMLLETLLAAGWRHHLLAQLYWDFQLLDSDGDGRLPPRDAELLLREVPGMGASGPAWHSFLQEHRHGLAWRDIEAWISADPQPHPGPAWAPGQGRRVEPGTGCPSGTGAGTEDSSLLGPWAMHRPWQLLDGFWDSAPFQVVSRRGALAGPRLVAGRRAVPSWTSGAEALWSRAAQPEDPHPPPTAHPATVPALGPVSLSEALLGTGQPHWAHSAPACLPMVGTPGWVWVSGCGAQPGEGLGGTPQEMLCSEPGALPAWELLQRETGARQPHEQRSPEAPGPPQRGQRLLLAPNALQRQGTPQPEPEAQERGELETRQPRGSPPTAQRGLQKAPGAQPLQGAPQTEQAALEPQDPQALEAQDQGEPRAQKPQGHPHGEQVPLPLQWTPQGDPVALEPPEQREPLVLQPQQLDPPEPPQRELGPRQAQGVLQRNKTPLGLLGALKPQGSLGRDLAALQAQEPWQREPEAGQSQDLRAGLGPMGLRTPEPAQRQLETRQAPGSPQREPGAPESLGVPQLQEVLRREPQGQQAPQACRLWGAPQSELRAPQLQREPQAPAPQEVRGPPEPLQPQGSLQSDLELLQGEQGRPQEGREPVGPVHQDPKGAEPLLPWDTPQSEPEPWGTQGAQLPEPWGAQLMEPSGAPQPQGAVLRDPPWVHPQGLRELRPAPVLGPGSIQAQGMLHGEELPAPQLQPALPGEATPLELGPLWAQGHLQGDPKVNQPRELAGPRIPQLHKTPLGPLQPRESPELQELKGEEAPQVPQLKGWGPGASQPQGALLREALGPRELGGPQVLLPQALIGPEVAQPWRALLLEVEPAQHREQEALEPLEPQEPETEEPQVSLQRELETEEPQVSLQRELETEEPQVPLQRETETEEPRVSLQREPETEEPQESLQWELETEKPRESLQRETETEEPRVSLQRELETEEPQESLQWEPEALEPQVSLQPESEALEPRVSLQREPETEEPWVSLQLAGEALPAQGAVQWGRQAHQLLEPAEATGPSSPSPRHPGQSPGEALEWDQAVLGTGGCGASPGWADQHSERGGEAMGPCWPGIPAPCGQLGGSPLRREKAFVRPSRREQQEAVRRLAELQLEGGHKRRRDKERQLLRFQERLSIARHRSVENLLGRPQPPAEPQLQEARAQQREALKQHLEQVKRVRTHGMQARGHRNTLSFQELLEPLVPPGEEGSDLSRAGKA
ncbi:unnamed protein product [Natator depressus]